MFQQPGIAQILRIGCANVDEEPVPFEAGLEQDPNILAQLRYRAIWISLQAAKPIQADSIVKYDEGG
jgi:hypothetical protein